MINLFKTFQSIKGICLEIGVSYESETFCQKNVRQMQGYQEKRCDSSDLRESKTQTKTRIKEK